MNMLQASLFLAVLTIHCVLAAPVLRPKSSMATRDTRRPVMNNMTGRAAPVLKVAEHVLPLRKIEGKTPSSAHLLKRIAAASPTLDLITTEGGASYSIEVDFGGKTVTTVLDTGSSDFWLPTKESLCNDILGQPQPTDACGFSGFVPTTFQKGHITGQNLNVSYSDGTWASGLLGYEDVTNGGMTVKQQEVGLASSSYWHGDGSSSGVLGFAYPTLTNAYNASDPAYAYPNTTIFNYNPWFFNAVDQKSIDPCFSLALQRGDKGGGYLSLGGYPENADGQEFASVDLMIVDYLNNGSTPTDYSYYAIVPDGFVLEGEEQSGRTVNKRLHTNYTIMVDSGTSLTYLPPWLAQYVNMMFDPPSAQNALTGLYENSCDAKPPSFAITIGGKDLYFSSEDLMLTRAIDHNTAFETCVTGIHAFSEGSFILGGTFLRNVVAVFDVGKSQMHFSEHKY